MLNLFLVITKSWPGDIGSVRALLFLSVITCRTASVGNSEPGTKWSMSSFLRAAVVCGMASVIGTATNLRAGH